MWWGRWDWSPVKGGWGSFSGGQHGSRGGKGENKLEMTWKLWEELNMHGHIFVIKI